MLFNIFSFVLTSCKVFIEHINIYLVFVDLRILYQLYSELIIKYCLFLQINSFFSYIPFLIKLYSKSEFGHNFLNLLLNLYFVQNI